MFERLGHDARSTVHQAQLQAREEGAGTIEAPHLLLALTEAPGRAGRVLANLGMTGETVRAALDREFADALAAVGVHESLPARRKLSTPRRGFPRWGQSAKLAIKRALGEAIRRGDGKLGNEHLLLAVVSAEA